MATNRAARTPTGFAAWSGRTRAFFRGVWSELKKVHWPTRRELVIYTGVVLVSVVVMVFLIWILDSFLSLLMGLIF